uniref:DUF5808 domain-containing protein n=1 Tax=Caenorhabditis tropicalis TaxID=1561998 RepID=A0A1I7UWL7_9PELO
MGTYFINPNIRNASGFYLLHDQTPVIQREHLVDNNDNRYNRFETLYLLLVPYSGFYFCIGFIFGGLATFIITLILS